MKGQLLTLAAAALLAAGCSAGPEAAAGTQKTVISLKAIDCGSCGYQIVDDLRRIPGVTAAEYMPDEAEIVVMSSPSVDVFTRVRQLAANEGIEALLGSGKGSYEFDETLPKGLDYARVHVPPGGSLDFKSMLTPGKTTIVDFSSTWCQPCREVDTHLRDRLIAGDPIAFRKIDIGDWDSDVAQRYLNDVPSLPYLIVFAPDGSEVSRIAGLDLAKLDKAIASAAPPSE